MMNCWSFGIFLCGLLASFCIWNCLWRDDNSFKEDWYGCVDQSGKPTNFFIAYKLPKNKSSRFASVRDGTAYMYLTPESSTRMLSGGISSVLSYPDTSSSWVLSNVTIKDPTSMMGRTLQDLYSRDFFRLKSAYFFYNDEFPNGTTTLAHGHTKGIFVMNKLGGYWLIHSVPKYPPPPDQSYSYPDSAHRYGQSMLCISLPPANPALVENIARQLIENDVYVYSWDVPDCMRSKYPILDDIPKRKRFESGNPPFYRVAQIPSALGKVFTSFSKSKKFGADLYDNLIAPMLSTSLFVESWRNGPEPLPSECNSTYKVENIQSINAHSAYVSFTTHHDHSKWAISQDSDKPYVCIGDINRMETQFVRGGGSVCISSLSIWHRFRNLIETTETCRREFP